MFDENGEIYSFSSPNADNLTNGSAHDYESAFLDDDNLNVSEFTYERFIKGYFSNNLSILHFCDTELGDMYSRPLSIYSPP